MGRWAAANMQQIGVPMPSHHAHLPASKEVILEIQLNKLINDFLFSSVEDRTATTMPDDADGSKLMPMHGNPSWELGSNPSCPSWEMDSPSCATGNPSYPSAELGNPAYPSWNMGSSQPIRAVPRQNLSNVPTLMPAGSNDILNNTQNDRCPSSSPSTEEERVFSNMVKTSSSNRLKFLHLSKAYSEASSLLCLAMDAPGHNEEAAAEENKVHKSSLKLTRMGSLPSQSKLQSEAETQVKHTCRKPPRPPRSSSEKRACSLLSRCPPETILVLHSSSRRAKTERRKRLAAASSFTTSMWALIFTFCFSVAMIGQAFWFQGTHTLAMETSNNVAPADSHIKSNIPASSMDLGVQSSLHNPGQLEREIQLQAFWISKGLDPA